MVLGCAPGRVACVACVARAPLWKSTAAAIRAWLRANRHLRGSAALLPNRSGHPITRCNVAQRLALAVDRASVALPSLKSKRVTPHTSRHTTAMHLHQSGVPFNVIALWLGHESTNTTHRDVETNLEMKEKALVGLEAPDVKLKRFRASDNLMKFLKTLSLCKAPRPRTRIIHPADSRAGLRGPTDS